MGNLLARNNQQEPFLKGAWTPADDQSSIHSSISSCHSSIQAGSGGSGIQQSPRPSVDDDEQKQPPREPKPIGKRLCAVLSWTVAVVLAGPLLAVYDAWAPYAKKKIRAPDGFLVYLSFTKVLCALLHSYVLAYIGFVIAEVIRHGKVSSGALPRCAVPSYSLALPHITRTPATG